MEDIKKYDVIYGEFPDIDGSVQSGKRPGVVIQNNIGNKHSPTLIAIPLTKQIKHIKQPTHLLISQDRDNGLKIDSMLLAEQITTINKKSIRKIGKISNRDLQRAIFKCFIYSAAYGDDTDLKDFNIG